MSADGSMGMVETQFIQHMITPDGTVLHQWDAVATAVFVWNEEEQRYIELRWHASLRGDAAGTGKLMTVLSRAACGKAGGVHIGIIVAILVAVAALLAGSGLFPTGVFVGPWSTSP